MPNFHFLLTLYSVLCLLTVVLGYPRGAPPNTCGDPAPLHQRRINTTHVGIFYPQFMETSVYTLETNLPRYSSGSVIRGIVYLFVFVLKYDSISSYMIMFRYGNKHLI